MFNTTAVQGLPGVVGTILGGRDGTLIEALEEADGETTAAVSAFAVSQCAQVGEQLGLGEVGRLTIAGGPQTSILCASIEHVVTVRIDASRPATVIEKQLAALSNSNAGPQ